jgi:hypothetical protein
VLDELDEDPSGPGGVKEGNLMAGRPWTGLCIDQAQPGSFEAREVRDDVVGTVGDVVQALTPSLQKAAYGSFRAEWFEEFDLAHEGHADSLGFEDLDRGTGLSRQEFIQDCTLLERVNGNRHVIERATRRIDRIHQRPVPEGAVRVNGT